MLWHLWVGRWTKHPGPFRSGGFRLEALNVGGWLTHWDFALETSLDLLAVSEHRQNLLGCGMSGLVCGKRVSTLSGHFSQEGSHVGHAGGWVVSLGRAPLGLPSFATVAFRRFFELGCLVRCVFCPLGMAG